MGISHPFPAQVVVRDCDSGAFATFEGVDFDEAWDADPLRFLPGVDDAAKVLVHGVDINARPGPVAEAPPAAELSMMNPVVAPNQVSLAEMRRRRRVERTRRTLRTPWLPSHGHVRRAPYAPNGTYLFPTPSSNLLSKKVRTRCVSRVLCFRLREMYATPRGPPRGDGVHRPPSPRYAVAASTLSIHAGKTRRVPPFPPILT